MQSTTPITAYIALGANLGNREGNIQAAIEQLASTPGIQIVLVSSLFENPAVGGPSDSPPFLNAAAEVSTTLSAADLLQRMLAVEGELGRTRRERWEPRLIDLDLLLYGQQIIKSDALSVPHPRMHQRTFVLQPLAQIAPHVQHPQFGRSIVDLLADLIQATETERQPMGFFDRMNLFDKICAALAVLFGTLFVVLGGIGLFIGCSAHFTLPPILGVLPAFAGWGMFKSAIVAIRVSSRTSAVSAARGFPLD